MAEDKGLTRTASESGTTRSKRPSNEKEALDEHNILEVEYDEALPNMPAVIFTEGGWRAWSTIAGACVFPPALGCFDIPRAAATETCCL